MTSSTLTFSLYSPAFEADGEIPVRYTCDGEDLSPPLSWENVPEGTQSLALIVEDPDAPDPKAPETIWVHWIVYNLPPDARELPEGAAQRGLPGGALQGLNDWKRVGYGGPCPPVGRHRYFHKLYALDLKLPDLAHPSKADVQAAIDGHVLDMAVRMGTYERKR